MCNDERQITWFRVNHPAREYETLTQPQVLYPPRISIIESKSLWDEKQARRVVKAPPRGIACCGRSWTSDLCSENDLATHLQLPAGVCLVVIDRPEGRFAYIGGWSTKDRM